MSVVEPESADEAAIASYRVTEQVGHLLRRAHQRASQIFQRTIGEEDLTPTQFAALAMLFERGSLSQNLLGRLTAMDQATIQGVVTRLLARGLVGRVPDPEDRRRFLVTLTPEGTALMRALIPNGHRVTAETLAPLSPDEQALFLELLRRVT